MDTEIPVESSLTGRRDAALGLSSPASLFDADAWESAPRPDLDRVRRVNVPRTPETYIYFQKERSRYERTNWWIGP